MLYVLIIPQCCALGAACRRALPCLAPRRVCVSFADGVWWGWNDMEWTRMEWDARRAGAVPVDRASDQQVAGQGGGEPALHRRAGYLRWVRCGRCLQGCAKFWPSHVHRSMLHTEWRMLLSWPRPQVALPPPGGRGGGGLKELGGGVGLRCAMVWWKSQRQPSTLVGRAIYTIRKT